MKSTIHAILVALIFSSCSPIIFAGTYSGGKGTEEDPYQISTVNDWQEITTTPADWNQYFTLTNNIDFKDALITPIGNGSIQFTGLFDGAGYILKNGKIDIESQDQVGIFGFIYSGQILNLGVENFDITGNTGVGILVGYSNEGVVVNSYAIGMVRGNGSIGGLVGSNFRGNVTNCYSAGEVNGDGGLIGYSYGGTITSCHSRANVRNLSGTVGGLVGSSSFTVYKRCNATGNVNAGGTAGGLVGNSWYSDFSDCYATGTVISTGDCVGGLVGSNYNSISGCYATGAVIGTNNVGGLVGFDTGTIDDCYAVGAVTGTNQVGGLVGYNNTSKISRCYSTGNVSGTGSFIGGLCGDNYGIFIDCFWDMDTSGQTTSEGGTGQSTAEMKTKSTFTDAGWDFTMVPIWKMTSQINDSYPALAWQEPDLIITELTVTSPNGGEFYTIGTTRPISWDSEGDIPRVVLEYSLDNGQSWNPIETVDNTKSYEWLVPNTPSIQCLVRISKEGDPSVSDVSNTVFEVTHELVLFADANLKAAVEAKLGVTNPTYEDMLKLTYLDARTRGITSLVGLETALNITTLYLHQNTISDISPLVGLTKLTVLNLYLNNITDITPLSGLTKLYSLAISSNKITDISALAGLNNLIYLYINNNQINNFSAITGNTKFKEIYATRNAVLTEETYLSHIPTIRSNNPNLKVFQYDPGCKTLKSADANQDCKVNLLDLAVIASEWLTCNHIYDSMCP